MLIATLAHSPLRPFTYRHAGFFAFAAAILLTLIVSTNVKADPLMSRLAEPLSKNRQFSAPFTQLRYMKMFTKPIESGGTISFSHPDAIKLHYTRPFEAVIIFSGGKLVRYKKENGRYVEQPSMEIITKAITREMIRWMGADFGSDFPYSASLLSSDSLRVKLIPTNPAAAAMFSSIELTLAPAMEYIKKVALIEASGDSIVIVHQTPSFAPLPPDAFTVKQ